MIYQSHLKRSLVTGVALFIFMASSFAAHGFSLDDVLLKLSVHTSFEVGFKEEKIDPFFDIPIVSTGTVSFRAPHYVRKTINKPSKRFFELDGNLITVSLKENEKQTFLVTEQPEMAAFFESFRSILAGDKETLQQHFKVSFSGASNQWSITLKPINDRLSYKINTIVFSGQSDQLLRVETFMWNDESSILVLEINKRHAQ